MDTLDNEYAVEERLPILLSGIGGIGVYVAFPLF